MDTFCSDLVVIPDLIKQVAQPSCLGSFLKESDSAVCNSNRTTT